MSQSGLRGPVGRFALASAMGFVCLIACLSPAWAQTAKQLGVGTSTKFHTPSVPPPAGQDPWGPARALGIAGNESYPIPEDLCHVDMYRQTKADAAAKSLSCVQ